MHEILREGQEKGALKTAVRGTFYEDSIDETEKIILLRACQGHHDLSRT